MNECPKCGSFHISGPRYRSSESKDPPQWTKGALVYICYHCGYSQDSPTKDSQERP